MTGTPANLVEVGPDRRDEWDALVASGPSFGLLQSWEWGELKRRLGWRVVRLATTDSYRLHAGAQMLIRGAGRVASVAYVPRGPVGDWLEPDVAPLLLGELCDVARRNRAVFLRVEPSETSTSTAAAALQSGGFRPSPVTNQPRASIVVDLGGTEEALLRRMHHKTRYNIRLAARRGVTVRVGGRDDLHAAYEMLRATARRGDFGARSARYYRTEWEHLSPSDTLRMFVAEYDGEPVAVNVSAVFGSVGAYLHGASSGRHRERMPNHVLMWEAMRWARASGCVAFDLWGVPDEVGRAATAGEELPVATDTGGLWGVYRFKRGFSEQVVEHAGAFDFVFAPRLYRALHRLMARASAADRRGAVTAERDRQLTR